MRRGKGASEGNARECAGVIMSPSEGRKYSMKDEVRAREARCVAGGAEDWDGDVQR